MVGPQEGLVVRDIRIPDQCYDRKLNRARVWMHDTQRYKHVHSVDAKEYVYNGIASFFAPGDEPAPRVAQEAPRPSSTAPPARDEKPEPVIADDGSAAFPSYPFSAHTAEELRVFAKAAGIEGYDDMRKDKLVSHLIASGWTPSVS